MLVVVVSSTSSVVSSTTTTTTIGVGAEILGSSGVTTIGKTKRKPDGRRIGNKDDATMNRGIAKFSEQKQKQNKNKKMMGSQPLVFLFL